MPTYLFKASLSSTGAAGVLKEGGTARAKVIRGAVEGLGGSVKALYWAFGETDVYLIAELPGNEAAAAVSLRVSSSGAVAVTTVVLMTAEELDGATQLEVDWRPPGG